MSALTSLLVRDRVVPVSKIEEALHSQVFQGGDIEVILLEMGLVPEDVLSAYRAALFDLLPATREEVMKARDALRRVPAEMARSLGIVPIFFEGRSLVVAAWEPLYEPRLREVEAQLGCEVSVRIVNQARLASALAHHYGFELEPRLRRLSDALRRRDPGVVPYVRPPSDSMRPREVSRGFGYDVEQEGDGDSDSDNVATEVVPNPLNAVPEPDRAELVAPGRQSLAPPPVPTFAAPVAQAAAASTSRAGFTNESSGLVAVDLPRDEDEEGDDIPSGVSAQLASLVRGPITLERAMELLQVASQRDDVLFVLLRYVQQYFDFVCVFSVGKEGLRARMAHGAGLPKNLVESVFVPAPNSGLLADVVRDKRAHLGYLGSAPEEQEAASALHREPGRRGLVVPLELNQRVILVVYADRVGPGIALEHSGFVQAVVPAVTNALRRIILDAKTRGSVVPRASVPPPVANARVSSPPEPAQQVEARIPASARSSIPPPPPPATPFQSEQPAEVASERVQPALEPAEPGQAADEVAESGPRDTLRTPEESDSGETELEFRELGFDSQQPEFELPALEPEQAFDVANASAQVDDSAEQAFFGSELSAVDLDAFERMIRDDATSDLHAITPASPSAQAGQAAHNPRDNAQVRERIAGVPRTAPPPPMYEPAAPAQQNGNGYRYRGGAGLAQERVQHAASAQQADAAAATQDDARSERNRLSLVEPSVNQPSVIIDMGESVDGLVESLLRAPAGSEPREIDELLSIGESALPVLVQHFPGPLWFERARGQRRKPRGRDVSAVARAVTAFGERAAPYVASLLASGDTDRAYYALLVAGEIIHADLLDPVARRVLDRDDAVRALALEVLRSYAVLPQYDVVVRAISDLTERPGKDPRRQRVAVEALGALRDARTLRTLLVRLSDRDEQVVRAAHDALVVLTGQDFGFTSRRWETWVEGWGRAHRVEWLIESLLHQDENIRNIAGEELKLLTQQYFGYHPSLAKKDRELAQRKYREWWELEGRLNFNR